jgi:hypothetical protein
MVKAYDTIDRLKLCTLFSKLSMSVKVEKTTKTDADGNFSFIVKKGEEFIVIATSQRQVLDEEEKYYFNFVMIKF